MYESLRIISSSLKDEVAELLGDLKPDGDGQFDMRMLNLPMSVKTNGSQHAAGAGSNGPCGWRVG